MAFRPHFNFTALLPFTSYYFILHLLTSYSSQLAINNFNLITKIGDLVYKRAVVPDNALNMDIELIGAGDATKKLACAGCYIRYQLKDGGHSCQLILG